MGELGLSQFCVTMDRYLTLSMENPNNIEVVHNAINLIDGKNVPDSVVEDQVLSSHRQIIRSFRAKYNTNRKWYDKFADFMTEHFGNFTFLVFNFAWYVVWLIWNNGFIPGVPIFDTFPHNFLTMMVSLEAIFLSIFVLISQNRQSSIADLREEIDFNINVKAEKEITKILNMLDEIHDHLGLRSNEIDEELIEMKKITNLDEIEEQISVDYVKRKGNR